MANFVLLQELTSTLLANKVFAVKYKITMAVYCTWIAFAFNAFPDRVVDRSVLVLLVVDNNVLLRIVDYDICILANFYCALAVVNSEELSRIS